MINAMEYLESRLPEAIRLRRDLHAHPELSFAETRTTEALKQALAGCAGVEILPPLLPTGLCARVTGAKPGPVTYVRADIDALHMPEDTGLPFASVYPDACHSCGHDIHTAAGVLLLWTLAACKEQLCGTVTVIFQPAEEVAGGAKALLAAGLAQWQPKPDRVLGFHTGPGMPVGEIGFVPGPANASTDEVHITVKGPGGHGAHPYRCADPVATAAYLICQLQTVVSRENPAVQPAVLTFGQIFGGSAPNVIPTEVKMVGTLRAFHEEGRHKMWDAIRRISDCCCKAMRAEAEVEIREGVPVMVNDPDLCHQLAAAGEAMLGAEKVHWSDVPSPGSDDFSCYCQLAPSVMFRLGTSNGDPATNFGIHNPKNLFDEGSIRVAAAVLCQYLLG